MSRITWDERGKHLFETGVSRGVLYLLEANGRYGTGQAWNGLTAVNESPSGGESTPIFADNRKYANYITEENYVATIEAYDYPNDFNLCLGRIELAAGVTIEQQNRKRFGFCYQTKVGNDLEGIHYQYLIHIIYNCVAGLTEISHNTMAESPEPTVYSWEINADKIIEGDFTPTASLTLDRKQFSEAGILNAFRKLESILYGTDTEDPRLPTFAEIFNVLGTSHYLQDSDGNDILDCQGYQIQTLVFD